MQGMEHKLETGAIPIGQDRSPFVIPMNPSREFLDLLKEEKRRSNLLLIFPLIDLQKVSGEEVDNLGINRNCMWIDLPGNGAWGDGKRGRYKDKKSRCDWCALQRYILAGVILTFILWVVFKLWTSD